MSKNITIAEGENAKSFTGVNKLQTNLIEGGTQNWVPEDEAGLYADLTELQVSENGIYNAQDADVDGFSSVAVAVPGGEIPGGKEIKGIASEDVSLYQTVKVVQGKQDLTKVTNDTQEGWLRNSNNLVYRLVNNKYNGYNVTTGALKSKGTSTVYSATILNQGEAVALQLMKADSDTTHVKYKFLWTDGKSCEIEFDYRSYNGVNVQLGVNNGLIAVYHGLKDRVDVDGISMNATVDIYSKSGKLITNHLALMQHGWSGTSERTVSQVVPITKSKVACWFMTGNANISYANAIINSTGLHVNGNSVNPSDTRRYTLYLGYYGGYYYIFATKDTSSSYVLYRINIEDIENDWQMCLYEEKSPNTTDNLNYYGHFQAYVDGKYYLYNVKDLSPVYDKDTLENSASHSLLESDKYLVFGRTYRKSSEDMIIPTNVYPDKHSDDTVLGIMKEDCEGGEEGTVIVLFE